MRGLVLSLFSGMGALDEGFRRAGFCVVSAGDVAWSSLYDVRHFHPPAGVFEGVIGGDPCQSHSALANLVRAKGLEPTFPDMTGEFVRVVEEARPAWFLRENVPGAPDAKPAGYDVRSFLLDLSTLDAGDGTGHEQMRRRRFWFGTRDQECPELRRFIDFAWFVLTERAVAPVGNGLTPSERDKRRRQAVTHRADPVPVKLGGSGKRKATACDGRQGHRTPDATGRHEGAIDETGGHKGNPPRYSLAEMLNLQGLPADVFDHSPLTAQGKRKLVGNAVPLPMAEALARAVREALGEAERCA